MIGILELEMIGQGQEIPALMEEGPEVRTIRPANILQDALIEFKGRFLEEEGQVLME